MSDTQKKVNESVVYTRPKFSDHSFEDKDVLILDK